MATEVTTRKTNRAAPRAAPGTGFFSAMTLEKFLTAALVLFISGAWFSPVLPMIPATAFRLMGLALGFFVLRHYIPQIIAVLVRELPLTLLLIFCGVQIFWSYAYDNSLEPVILLYMTAFFGIYIAMRYTLEEQLSLMVWWLILAWFLSFAFILIFPEHGIHQDGPHVGQWHGMYAQKNAFGIALSLGVVPLLALWQHWGIWRYVIGGLILYTIAQTGSATALVTSILMIAAVPAFSIFRMHARLMIGMLMIVIPLLGFATLITFNNAETILGLLGRTTTLTGRTDLWQASVELIEMRPLIGWGLRGSFSERSPIHDIITWDAPYAHNHWIDTLLETGLIGLFLYVLTLIRTLWRSIRYASEARTIASLYPLFYVVVLHIALTSTQSLLTMFNSNWIFYVAVVYGLAIHNKRLGAMPYRRPYEPK